VAVLPIVNYTETPQAGLRAEAIAESLLKTGGVTNLKRYPASLNPETLFEPAERESVGKALDWARTERTRYALTGAVQEWRYKVGVDGEPAVGISLQLIDVATARWCGRPRAAMPAGAAHAGRGRSCRAARRWRR
jgi:TolB-like protein